MDVRQADAFDRINFLTIILATKMVILKIGVGQKNNDEQRYFDELYEEVFTELDTKYGPVEEMNVCENIGLVTAINCY